MLVYWLKIVFALDIAKLPSTGSPPNRLTGATAVHDDIENRIITFGGFDYQLNQYTSELKTFSLKSLEWGILTAHSNIIPPGLDFAQMYLREDRRLFVFFGASGSGNNNEVYSYDLLKYTWKIEELTGYRMLGRFRFAFTSFTYNNITYVGIFGGLTVDEMDHNLYLVNMETLEARKMPYNDQGPWIRVGTTLTYYNNTLYMYGYIRKGLAPNDDQTGIYAYSLIEEKWTLIPAGDKPAPEMRFEHYAYLYNDEMYIIFGLRIDILYERRDIWKFNFSNQSWTLILNNIKDYKAESANVIIGSKVYLLYGRETYTVFNSILTIDLAQDIPVFEYISVNMLTPLKRMNHCDYMYIFGGLYSYGSYLNDMWRFHFTTEYWEPVIPNGDIPPARAQSACVKTSGNSFAIFGGTDGINAFDDLYFYHESYNTWIKAQVSGDKPSGRWSSCMCYYEYKYFIIGGQNIQQAFSDLWIYSYVDEKYTLVKSDFITFGIMRHNCWLTSDTDSVKINIIGGATFEFYPNPFVFTVQIFSNLYVEVSVMLYSPYVSFSETNIVISKNKLFMVYGSTWNKVAMPYFSVLDMITLNAVTKLAKLQSNEIYGHTVSHYGKAFYIFGGGISHNMGIIPNIVSNLLYKFTSDDDPDYKIPCSDGTLEPDCLPCNEGTYFMIDHCEPCPKGTYSPYISALYIEQCFPCPAGTFSPNEGSAYCIDCPCQTHCPIGTFEPKLFTENLIMTNIQPLSYSGHSKYITESVLKMWYFIVSLGLFILFIAIIFKKIWKLLSKVDVFANQHSQDLNVPIVYKRTNIGGLFSLLFILVAFVSIAGSIMNYTLNNITEIKALVPVITLGENIQAKSIMITSTFYIYGGECVSSINICSKDIEYSIKGIQFSKVDANCKIIENNCVVYLEFDDFQLEQTIASVYIELKESRSYASYIGVNITSSSSIPNEISSVFISATPPSKDYLFRGTTPTVMSYKFTPSVFTSESTEWPSFETGFHVSSYNDVVIGSLATQKTIHSQAYLRVHITIEKSDTGMTTQRKLNSTLFIFVGGLLGSVFGFMGIFTTAMAFTEGFVGYISKKEGRKVLVQDLYKNMEKLGYEFDKYKIKQASSKIRPACYQITTNYIDPN
ncbi:hypothetical protein SteCoe_16964 [Stentor coeruleus]|uniref:Tyrosine-protein kinase ephrin type A/B receptor-like domain-containing protein n=1 Tax=Stentor coeruleus TaxID=5963 RepID=A0A1R2BZZ1_9CILI|nr:hypothetical protein SteCoe_16964 [Stentor coeruleus]